MRSLLRSTRLLTLVGPAGAGKSRLAMEFAKELEPDGEQLIRQVDVAPLGIDDSLAAAVTSAVHTFPRHNADSADERGLTDTIGHARMLLLLDGCEHLVESCARFVDGLLHQCPELRVLATSRESLRIPAEVTLRVGGLLLPRAADRSARRLTGADSVRLFADRAVQYRPGFRPHPHAATIAEICKRLDGLPLGIELAARNLSTMSPGQLLSRLDDQLTRPHAPNRSSSRQREWFTAVERSHQLLNPLERAVFRRLSVLPDGFDLDAATAVCADYEVPPSRILQIVCALEGKSLITRSTGGTGAVRFRQWQGVRGYAADRLTAEGEVTETRTRAMRWFAELAGSLAETLFVADNELHRLGDETENLAASMEYARTRDVDRHVLLTVALARVHWQQGRRTQARALLTPALGHGFRSRHLGELLVWSALAASTQSDDGRALRLAARAERQARASGDPIGLAKALDALGFVRMTRREFALALDTYRRCLTIVRSLDRPLDTARCLHCLAWSHLLTGDLTEAEELLGTVIPVYRSLGSRQQQAAAFNTLGALRLSRGDTGAAGAAFAEALGTADPDDDVIPDAVDGLAMVAAEQGATYRSVCLASAASAVRSRLSSTAPSPWRSWIRATTARAEAGLGEVSVAARRDGRKLYGENLRRYALRPATVDACGCAGRADQKGPLSPRERQTAELVADGLTNREIADRLHVSIRTVRAHITNIHGKLGLRSRTQIAAWVVRAPGRAGR